VLAISSAKKKHTFFLVKIKKYIYIYIYNKIVIGMLNKDEIDIIVYFMKVFDVLQYKNWFLSYSSCSSEEIFVSLKEVGQVGLIFYIMVNLG